MRATPISGSTTAAASTTVSFHIVNGQIIAPNGGVFTAEGINVYESQMGAAAQILADFPGINFIRLNVYSYQSPSAYAAFIQTMTSKGVVVELEDHTNSNGSNAGGGSGTAFTGSQLTNELNWYAAVASAYASNPYVWFGTDNEPPAAGLSSWEQATYNAIRGTGNTNPIMIELPGGGDPGQNVTSYGMDPSVYTAMSNIVVDAHFYGWGSSYSTNQSTVDSALSTLTQGAQTIQSANRTVPVIIGEYGPSTNGTSTDANATQVLQAVQQAAQTGATAGAVAWGWNSGVNDNLTDGQGNLTFYGQEVAQWIAAHPGSSKSSGSPPSPNDTVVKAGSTAAIIDSADNAWTITSGAQVAINGVADSTTANVIELAYVNGTIWQENTAHLWWGETQPNASWAPTAGTAISPLPATSSTPTLVLTDDKGTTASVAVINSGTQVAVGGSQTPLDGNLSQTIAGNGVANIATAAFGSGIVVVSLKDTTGTAYSFNNFLSTNVELGGAKAGSLSISGAAGGTVKLDAGNYMVTVTAEADSGGSAAQNQFNVTLGGPGNDTLHVDDSATHGISSNIIQAGAGVDFMWFVGTASTHVTGGSGAASVLCKGGTNSFVAGTGTLLVASGSGADSYTFHAGDGLLRVYDFSLAKGDSLAVDKALSGALTEASDGHGGLMLSFGTAGHGINLVGTTALSASQIHFV